MEPLKLIPPPPPPPAAAIEADTFAIPSIARVPCIKVLLDAVIEVPFILVAILALATWVILELSIPNRFLEVPLVSEPAK